QIHYMYFQTESFLFFFQAEDGIRDFHVTGVQTCALPISMRRQARSDVGNPYGVLLPQVYGDAFQRSAVFLEACHGTQGPLYQTRSEERRVGKECIDGLWSYR